MHTIEPYYNWRNIYISSEDYKSPFFGREYSEFHFTNRVYNFLLHPQWDDIGSPSLFIKIIYADYDRNAAIIEMIGEWNDCINNDIMTLKRDIFDSLIDSGLNKFILIGENVLNFHSSDDCYYEELFDDVEDGWIVLTNFHDHVLDEFSSADLDNYLIFGEDFDTIEWRTYHPIHLIKLIDKKVNHRFSLPVLE